MPRGAGALAAGQRERLVAAVAATNPELVNKALKMHRGAWQVISLRVRPCWVP